MIECVPHCHVLLYFCLVSGMLSSRPRTNGLSRSHLNHRYTVRLSDVGLYQVCYCYGVDGQNNQDAIASVVNGTGLSVTSGTASISGSGTGTNKCSMHSIPLGRMRVRGPLKLGTQITVLAGRSFDVTLVTNSGINVVPSIAMVESANTDESNLAGLQLADWIAPSAVVEGIYNGIYNSVPTGDAPNASPASPTYKMIYRNIVAVNSGKKCDIRWCGAATSLCSFPEDFHLHLGTIASQGVAFPYTEIDDPDSESPADKILVRKEYPDEIHSRNSGFLPFFAVDGIIYPNKLQHVFVILVEKSYGCGAKDSSDARIQRFDSFDESEDKNSFEKKEESFDYTTYPSMTKEYAVMKTYVLQPKREVFVTSRPGVYWMCLCIRVTSSDSSCDFAENFVVPVKIVVVQGIYSDIYDVPFQKSPGPGFAQKELSYNCLILQECTVVLKGYFSDVSQMVNFTAFSEQRSASSAGYENFFVLDEMSSLYTSGNSFEITSDGDTIDLSKSNQYFPWEQDDYRATRHTLTICDDGLSTSEVEGLVWRAVGFGVGEFSLDAVSSGATISGNQTVADPVHSIDITSMPIPSTTPSTVESPSTVDMQTLYSIVYKLTFTTIHEHNFCYCEQLPCIDPNGEDVDTSDSKRLFHQVGRMAITAPGGSIQDVFVCYASARCLLPYTVVAGSQSSLEIDSSILKSDVVFAIQLTQGQTCETGQVEFPNVEEFEEQVKDEYNNCLSAKFMSGI